MPSQSRNIWTSVLAGALGGATGSYAMNQFQSLWSKASAELSEEKEEGQSSGDEPATVKTAEAISQNLFQHELGGSEKK